MTRKLYGCPAGAHVRAPSTEITEGIAADLSEDEINELLWNAAFETDALWGGWGDTHDRLLAKGYTIEDKDGWVGLTAKGVGAAVELFAARRRALDRLACSPHRAAGVDVAVGRAVISDRFNGASWQEIADALAVTTEQADIYITYV